MIVAALLVLAVPQHAVVPAPQSMQLEERRIPARATSEVPAFAAQVAAYNEALDRVGAGESRSGVRLVPGYVGDDEGYRIEARADGLVVMVSSARGAARAMATLFQLTDDTGAVPAVTVDDAPERPFRCFMVDLGRNPHPPETMRQVVDLCWFYKVGYLHLHLTDDQLSSWPSKAFPKLRDERAGWEFEDWVALESYAVARGVALIPEIDVPGHSSILRGRYPEVFGESTTDLATRPSATEGMQRLLDELMAVFASSPYVHLGGDEAYGVPQEEQRRFINRLAAHVRERGRRAIVWEGPRLGEGDHRIANDVIHMNWDTVHFPAQAMLDAGYEVVNAAWDPMYIVDHYPRTMFTAVPVELAYGFDARRFKHIDHGFPTFKQPHVTTSAEGILGFCMPWWEGRHWNLLPLCAPRLAAVAAAAWNRDGEDDFAGFQERQVRMLPRLERLVGASLTGTPYADATTQVGNLAFRAQVTPSWGASQPVYGPDRLTNGLTDRFDHFLGYPTKPEPLAITIELRRPETASRVIVHETAVGSSYEKYLVDVSADGENWTRVGATEQGTRGEASFVEHTFEPRVVRYVRITTEGCESLTFPSFSRLTEVVVR